MNITPKYEALDSVTVDLTPEEAGWVVAQIGRLQERVPSDARYGRHSVILQLRDGLKTALATV